MATKSPVPASPGTYFPQQQHYPVGATDTTTLSNTLANSHMAQPDNTMHLAAPVATRPNGNGRFTEEWDASQRGSSLIDTASPGANMQRANSFSSSVAGTGSVIGDGSASLSRGNTLRKKASLRRSGSLKRSSSRRSMKAGSVRSLALQATTDHDETHSAFYCPVPTSGSPTEVLASRFQAWRKLLKDLITFFREIQTHYEHRGKSLIKLGNSLNNTTTPSGFLASGGLDDALQILRSHNKVAMAEASKAREIEEDVILALTGLRADLQLKIKEIKSLSGDFKNSVEKEMDATRRAVNNLQEILGQTELDSALTTGKQDPYLLKLAVDRQLERQVDEENYLHQAYLNLENSGRELEAIIVGEIQKSYNAYAGILKREADAAYSAIDELRAGPITMPKDTEWVSFIRRDDRFVDPDLPMRSAQLIHYPGRDHPACQELRAGLLERKSKYLKSYTAGWYVLSPTHLHEFKSADKAQAPVMSLYLPEQKLGSHSTEGGSSNKFVLKGRQTGSMHRGHTWVFRAESHDTMMAWYEDIKALTERSPEERNNYVRGQVRSLSRASQRSSMSSDAGVDDDEDPPFAANATSNGLQQARPEPAIRRPSGGRFPSDIEVNAQRGLQVPLSPLSVSSGLQDNPDGGISPLPTSRGNSAEYPRHLTREANGVLHATPPRAGQEIDSVASNRGQPDGYWAEKPQIPSSQTFGYNTGNTSDVGTQPNNGIRNADALEQSFNGNAVFMVARDDGNSLSPAPEHQRRIQLKDEPIRTGLQENPGYTNGQGDWAYGAMPGVGGNNGTTEEVTRRMPQSIPRPGGGPYRNDTTPTISHLHVPGEYPKNVGAGFI
ncbi:putative 4,5-bisphosphate-binding protein [Podospora conica]|nr:putative 4,5-bisphosphate-binding protein [Schizothecium conicum]